MNKSFPRVMLTKDHKDQEWTERLVIGITTDKKAIALAESTDLDVIYGSEEVYQYEQYKEVGKRPASPSPDKSESNIPKIKFLLGQTVYIKTDKFQEEAVVREIKITPIGVIYSVSHNRYKTEHYEIELSSKMDTSNILS